MVRSASRTNRLTEWILTFRHKPAQDRFVVPYGVPSVLGMGSTLGDRDIFAVLLFFRVEISPEVAQLLSQLTVSIKIGLSTNVHHLFR